MHGLTLVYELVYELVAVGFSYLLATLFSEL